MLIFEIGSIPDRKTVDHPQTEEFYKDMLNSLREQVSEHPQ